MYRVLYLFPLIFLTVIRRPGGIGTMVVDIHVYTCGY